MNKLLLPLLLLIVLAGCASNTPAPVVDRTLAAIAEAMPAVVPPVTGPEPLKPGYYMVRKGDTLHGIALDNGQNYRDIAAWNNLENPNRIEVGQQLRVIPPDGGAVVKPVTPPARVDARPTPVTAPNAGINTDALKKEPKGGKQPFTPQAWEQVQKADAGALRPMPPAAEKPAEVVVPPPAAAPVATDDTVDWGWPGAGRVIANFVEGSNKGLDLAGKAGDPVSASAAGKVVYAGTGLRGYGKLVILKHNATYLTAYAHNQEILVKEGQSVTKGQKIAELGNTDSDVPKLHFEIRKLGKPIDPLKLLPAR